MLHYRAPRRRHRDRAGHIPRRRVVALIVGAGGILTVIVVGLILSIVSVLGVGSQGHREGRADVRIGQPAPAAVLRDTGVKPANTSTDPRDGTSPEDSEALDDAGRERSPMVLPPATVTGPGSVATGYPQSAEGAVAQLGSIDVAVLRQPASEADKILRTWSREGKGAAGSWTILNIIDDLQRTRTEASGAPIPLLAAVDRSEAPSRYDVCLAFTRVLDNADPVYTHCETMIWAIGHWAIVPERTPARAARVPLTWADAYQNGFRRIQSAASPTQR